MSVGEPLAVEQLVPGFVAENDLERAVVAERELLQGLAWGHPRFGHPEARVGLHVAAILGCLGDYATLRADLRLIALVHDSFKYKVRSGEPWSRENDHAAFARGFAARFTNDERVLCAIELHDELYWIWNNGSDAIEPVLARVPDVELYLRFVELDASTEGKDPSLLWWIRHAIAERGLWLAPPLLPGEPVASGSAAVYVETFATTPGAQDEVARAASEVVDAGEELLKASGEVLRSEDGERVLIVWRWSGHVTDRLLREGGLIRWALKEHQPLLRAEAREARVFRPVGR